MKKYIYLSHFLSEDTPLYGGEKKINIKSAQALHNGDSSNSKMLCFPNHAGTHVDFPRHFHDEGKTIKDYAPDYWLFNNPFLIRKRAKPNTIIDLNKEIRDLPRNIDFLIIKTFFFKFRGKEPYWKYNPSLAPQLASQLKNRCPDLKAIGFDFISLSGYQNRALGRVAHKEFLLNTDLLIIEDMKLDELSQSPIRVIGLPLLVEEIDGAPITIIAEIE